MRLIKVVQVPANGNSSVSRVHTKTSARQILNMSIPPTTLVIIGASANNAQRQRQKQQKSNKLNLQQQQQANKAEGKVGEKLSPQQAPQQEPETNAKSNSCQIS
ncbi:uncharacterized protein LOC111592188 [Drosophila hydei]|uniref:Uncharacterized protein LOC111592188 n=1 Tax=Drosophila hydei TaxID=7224 RepID=A0A6J1L309_DROHY|nr:uncharacterized protein LOC111592188 [Drosophila hydei]